MENTVFVEYFGKELETEYTATKKCIERIPETQYTFKPHPSSMAMGYLTSLVSSIPLWVAHMIEKGEIDLAKFPRPELTTTQQMVNYFEENFQHARRVLNNATDANLQEMFTLKSSNKTLYKTSILDSVSSTLNHWVHHRGQLTVYMRLQGIEVPSIYGPSADDNPYT